MREELKARRERLNKETEARKIARENDAVWIITSYLKGRGISFQTKWICRKGERAAGAVFFLEKSNTVLSYRNPHFPEHFTSGGYKPFCKASGGNVHEIASAEREDILNQLRAICP